MQPQAFVAVQIESPAPAPTIPSTLDVQVRLANGIALDLRGCDADGARGAGSSLISRLARSSFG